MCLAEEDNSKYMFEQHKNICLLCSLGCGLIIETEFNEALNLEYDRDDPVGEGTLCSKGNYALELINHPFRLVEPASDGKILGWDETINTIAQHVLSSKEKSSVGLILGGDASLEDVITARYFTETCLNNDLFSVYFATGDDEVQHALAPNPTATMDDIEKSDCILAVGDPFTVGPVIARRILRMKRSRKGNMLTVISKEANATSRFATVHLKGPERTVLTSLLRAVMEKSEGNSPEWKKAVTENETLSTDPAVLRTAEAFVKASSATLILETQDPVTAQLTSAIVTAAGTDKRLYPLNSYGNTRGICEMLGERKTVGELIDAVERGELETLIILGGDPLSGVPGRDIVSALGKVGYLVTGAAFENKTTQIAHMVLPTALWLETEGTYNGENRKPVIEPPGGALSYGEILKRIAVKMGEKLPEPSLEPVQISEELTGEKITALLQKAKEEAPEYPVQSTAIRHADGSLTDAMSFMKFQGRKDW